MRAAVSASKRCVCDACTAPKQNETPQIATKCWLRDETPKLLASCNSTNETKPPKLQQHMCGLQAHLGLVDQLHREGGGGVEWRACAQIHGWKNRRKEATKEQKSKATMPTTEEQSNNANASSSCSRRPPDRLSIGSTERVSPHSAANSSTARTDFPPPLPRFRCQRVSATRATRARSGRSCLHLP